MSEPPIKSKPKRYSVIWKLPKSELEKVVAEATTIADILRAFGLKHKGDNYKTLHKRLKEEGIDYSHIALGYAHNRGKKFPSKAAPLETYLVEHSSYNRHNLKRRLFKEGLLRNQCYVCGQSPEWNDKPLSLQLDHINGISDDNRIENLRILCPNCHSQTDTFAGKSKRQTQDGIPLKVFVNPFKLCQMCGSATSSKKNKLCRKCYDTNRSFYPQLKERPNARKVVRPSKEELEKMLWEKPTMHIAKQFGVSDKAIEKWAKVYGLAKPPRGYWAKMNAKDSPK